MIKDLLNSLGDNLYERSTSPFIGSFVVSWSVVNFEFWLLFFSELDIEEKLGDLSTFLDERSLALLIWAPLVATALYILAYPYLLNFLSWGTLHAKVQGSRLLGRHADATYVKATDFERYKKESREELFDKENVISRKEQQIRDLTNSVQELNKQAAELEESNSSLTSKVQSLEKELKHYRDMEEIDQAVRASEIQEFENLADVTNNLADDHSFLGSEFTLYFNPHAVMSKNKKMRFANGGKIVAGKNNNESTWQISDGKLEFLDSRNAVHNRFVFDPDSRIFKSTNDADVGAITKHNIKDQILAFADGSSVLPKF